MLLVLLLIIIADMPLLDEKNAMRSGEVKSMLLDYSFTKFLGGKENKLTS